MDKRSEKKEILNGIYAQIGSFDSKAGLLISILGIVFGLSLDFFGIFSAIPMYAAQFSCFSDSKGAAYIKTP